MNDLNYEEKRTSLDVETLPGQGAAHVQ
jgi:hypothetical protein